MQTADPYLRLRRSSALDVFFFLKGTVSSYLIASYVVLHPS